MGERGRGEGRDDYFDNLEIVTSDDEDEDDDKDDDCVTPFISPYSFPTCLSLLLLIYLYFLYLA